MSDALSQQERARRTRLESAIDVGRKQSLEMAKALKEIHDKKLWRGEYTSFGDYCQRRWDWSVQYVYYLIDWAEVVERVATTVDAGPTCERHARPLAKLPPELHVAAWRRFLETRTGKNTGSEIAAACQHVRREWNARNNPVPAVNWGDSVKLICADVIDGFRQTEDGSISLVVTSPPYGEQRNGHYPGVPEADYPDWFVGVMRALRPKLADDASVLVVIRSRIVKGNVSTYVLRTRLALRDDGWCEPGEIVWKKGGPPWGHKQRPRCSWEHVLWYSKTTAPFADLYACGQESDRIGFVSGDRFRGSDGVRITGGMSPCRIGTSKVPDMIDVNVGCIEPGIPHPAVFPQKLADTLIQTFSRPGDLVADIFMGSGQTLLAARPLGRRCLGIDIKPEYVELARHRLEEQDHGHTDRAA